ncbi:hypothetical protein CKM354_000887800 [Cercospora kikuchii]|uniref:Uncharacterized protein n=1 Tax=Cercospora kikuchii TaxID=84275 RepID=A0A9P3FFN7_9PEZI|nr:uncharacterized protein CKM354_000887800 [Cercospora kikuchii]GIZ45723.1 hypothetical protein CKM354_000887800 [Cercospora kikuchii]
MAPNLGHHKDHGRHIIPFSPFSDVLRRLEIMRSLSLTSSLSIFASLSLAFPQLQCYSNKCNLLVRVKGKQACSSFLRTTVTPCPVTSTITAASTVFVTSTSTMTQFATVTSTATITPEPSTTTTTTTFTATSTLRLNPLARKRTNSPPSTCPRTSSPSQVPDFARSVCETRSAFATACECLGIKPSTTTLPASTVYTTITTQQTVQETSLTIVTSTSTEVTTTTIPASTTTVTSTVSTTSNAVARPTSCFVIRPSDDGRYGQMSGDNRFTFQLYTASIFSLTDGDTGYLYDYAFFQSTVGAVDPTPEQYPDTSVSFMRLVDINGPLATSIQCVRANDALTCATDIVKTRFLRCSSPGTLNEQSELLLLAEGAPVPQQSGCLEITLRTEDFGCP